MHLSVFKLFVFIGYVSSYMLMKLRYYEFLLLCNSSLKRTFHDYINMTTHFTQKIFNACVRTVESDVIKNLRFAKCQDKCSLESDQIYLKRLFLSCTAQDVPHIKILSTAAEHSHSACPSARHLIRIAALYPEI